jgi:hypothetical protein
MHHSCIYGSKCGFCVFVNVCAEASMYKAHLAVMLHLTEGMVTCAGATPRAGARVQAPATASRAGLGPAAT